MTHELLLALRGFPRGLFGGGGLQVCPPELPFLRPSESGLLSRVCRLGALYVRFSDFIGHFATEHIQPQLPPPAQQQQPGSTPQNPQR